MCVCVCGTKQSGFFIVAMRFQVFCLIILSVPELCLNDPQMGDDTIYPEYLLTVGVIRWNKWPRCWQLKTRKTLLRINNYSLKHYCERIIYIYIYIYIYIEREREREREKERNYCFLFCFVLFDFFDRQTMEIFGWCSFSILFNFSESEVFAKEISFLIHLFLAWTSDLFSSLTLKSTVFIEDSLENKHSQLANQSWIILYIFNTFWLISQSNVPMYVCGKSIPSTF